MQRKLAVVAALALPLAAAAGDGSVSETMKKAASSNTSQNMKAKALSKIGMDYTPSAPGAKVYFIEPKNGAEIKGPVKVVFGLSGMGVAPAGVQSEFTGHHHVLIDGATADPNGPLPATEQVQHFGKGQTEATLTLKPGKHTLQLVLGDYKHQPHNPPVMSEVITITVK